MTTYSREDKYQDRCFIKERLGGCTNAQRRTLDEMIGNGRYHPTIKKSSGKRNYFTRRNSMK